MPNFSIEHLMPQIRSRAKAFASRNYEVYNKTDDLVQEACVALTVAFAKPQQQSREIDSTEKYLQRIISNAFKSFLDNDQLVGPKRSARIDRRKREFPFLPPQTTESETLDDDGEPECYKEVDFPESSLTQSDGLAAIDLRELIDSCCDGQQEKQIVALRAEGHTDEEVGTRLGISRLVVLRTRQKIEARFNEKSLSLSA